MSITTTCPHCGKSGNVPDHAAGMKATCKKCKTAFRVQVAESSACWEVTSGEKGRRLAVEQHVIGDSENFDAAVLTFSGKPVPGMVTVAGIARCHICGGEVHFEKEFFTSGLMSSRVACDGCSSQVDLMGTAGEKNDGCFIVASPGTQPVGSSARKMQLWLTRVGIQDFNPDIPKTPPPAAPPPKPQPQVGSRFCNRCETALTWWSMKMLGGAMNRPGVHTFGTFGGSGSRPAFFAGVCPSCQDGYCKDHAQHGGCPKCGSRLTE